MDPRIFHKADSQGFPPSMSYPPPRMSGDQTAQDPGSSLGELDQQVKKGDSSGLGKSEERS